MDSESELARAKEVLRGLRKEVSESNGTYVLQVRDQRISVLKSDIQEYISKKPGLQRTIETQLFYPGYYEHVVRFEGNGPRRAGRRPEEGFTLNSSDGQFRIELGRLSTLFCLGITDVEKIDIELRRLTLFPSLGSMRQGEEKSLGEIFRLSSIRVYAPQESSIGKNAKKMHELAEAAAFHIAYGQGTSISFTKSWDRTYYWLGRKEAQEVQFPLRTYNSELIAYYNLALASDSLILGYLALYKILEYFYTSASEASLHKTISDQLVAPEFSHTKPKKLRELVKAIRQYENRMDELSSLKLVISNHFEKSALRQWIEEYEEQHGIYFTKEVALFGSILKIDVNDSSIVQNISSRIYTIRNALVHNKEGEVGRFIPYTGQEELISKEVQIILFLAEQLIVKTGKDISF